ncbi:MAG: sigma-54-dependent Fis family transcriptional regulator [Candidatus Coatesbacteria bacterium]|nr:sigma-54-dependent Fis family transcriptional regulator [Candidatus Coatesbacteria bacterium]
MTDYFGKILVVDDDESMRTTLSLLLKAEGHEVVEAENEKEAIKKLQRESFDLVITDLRMEKLDSGIRVLKQVKQLSPDTEVLVETAYGSISSAIDAIKLGASDYITTPCENEEIIFKVNKALESHALSGEMNSLQHLQREQMEQFGYDAVIAVSEPMRQVMSLVRKIAPTEARALILGESGTGKELLARVIHYNGPRAKMPFVALNCAAIPESLLESELFGIARGTATGVSEKQGKFLQANRGTIFLDEIGDMSPATQAKVLRVLQEEEFVPLGAKNSIKIDVRVISATNQDLREGIRQGRFREDLLFRLNVFTVDIPPLRKRREDIIPLAEYILDRIILAKKKRISGFTENAQKALLEYSWPGNIRELENVIERAAIICANEAIDEGDLALDIEDLNRPDSKGQRPVALKDLERLHILSVLRFSKWNKAKAARMLGISRSTLWAKMKEFGLEDEGE